MKNKIIVGVYAVDHELGTVAELVAQRLGFQQYTTRMRDKRQIVDAGNVEIKALRFSDSSRGYKNDFAILTDRCYQDSEFEEVMSMIYSSVAPSDAYRNFFQIFDGSKLEQIIHIDDDYSDILDSINILEQKEEIKKILDRM